MRVPRRPAFLARPIYRRRRLGDAARVLPIVGGFLFFLPILWSPAQSDAPDTARGALYLFSVWIGLIAAAWLIARRLRNDPTAGQDAPESGDR